MEEELRRKKVELENLQQSFDDYVESSKELEAELEQALEQSQSRLKEANKRRDQAEDNCTKLQKKLNQLTKEYSIVSDDYIKIKEKNSSRDKEFRDLQNSNEELANSLRISQASEEDLRHELEATQEKLILLKQDMEDLRKAKIDAESEFREELRAVRDELARMQTIANSIKDNNTSTTKSNGEENQQLLLTITELENEIISLKQLVDEKDNENAELSEELSTVTDEMIAMQTSAGNQTEKNAELVKLQNDIQKLSVALSELQQQIVDKENDLVRAKDRITELLSSIEGKDKEIEELNGKLVLKTNDIVTANADNETIVALKSTIQKLSDELTVTKGNLEKSRTTNNDIKSLNNGVSHGINTEISVNCESSSKIPQTIHINTTTSTQRQLADVLASTDVDDIKKQLLQQIKKYEDVRANNVKLLNKLQGLQGSIQVCCRFRPPNESELTAGGRICIEAADDTELMLYDGRLEAWKSFIFDRVWNSEANQADVFADVEPMVLSVVDGYNACIFAYGQTGSGKTYTMDGNGVDYGVSFRTAQKIFELLSFRKSQAEEQKKLTAKIKPNSNGQSANLGQNLGIAERKAKIARERKATELHSHTKTNSHPNITSMIAEQVGLSGNNSEYNTDNDSIADDQEEESPYMYRVEISMMEIYNDQVYDLLGEEAPQSAVGSANSLEIRTNPDGITSVPGLQSTEIGNLEDAMSVIARGSANRATGSTNLNEHSSRSHLILSIDVITQSNGETPVRGKLVLVDLAGSERVKNSGVTGTAMKEAQHINKSLSALGDVMEALDQKSKHVPYRNSKLTYLLQNCLGGNSRAMMIVAACPTDLSYEETLFTLQFATRIRNINLGMIQKTSLSKNLELQMKSLKSEIKELKKGKSKAEEIINEMKKDQKKVTEKSVTSLETKIKTYEDTKKSNELQITVLNKNNNEMSLKLQEEKSSKEKLSQELTILQASLAKAQAEARENAKEAQRLQMVLATKEKEIEASKFLYSSSSSPKSRRKSSSETKTLQPLNTNLESNSNGQNTEESIPTVRSPSRFLQHAQNQLEFTSLNGSTEKKTRKKSLTSIPQALTNSATTSRLTASRSLSANRVTCAPTKESSRSRTTTPVNDRSRSRNTTPTQSKTLGLPPRTRNISSDNNSVCSQDKPKSSATRAKITGLTQRSQDALARHQLRMDKKREAEAAEKSKREAIKKV